MLLKDVRKGNTNTASTKKNDEEHKAPQEGANGGARMLYDNAEQGRELSCQKIQALSGVV